MKNPRDGMTRHSMTDENPALLPDFSDDMESWDLRIPEPDEFGLNPDAFPQQPEGSGLSAEESGRGVNGFPWSQVTADPEASTAAPVPGQLTGLLQASWHADGPEEASEEGQDDRYCCVFMESGYETLVGKIVEYCGEGRVTVPQRVLPQYRGEKWQNVTKPLLPGYLFIRGEPARYRLRQINHVIRPLRYADGESALRGEDLDFARMMFSLDGTIPKLQAVEEGSFVHVTDSLLRRMNGKVLRVNKRGHLAQVKINLVGRTTTFWLGLDLPETGKD